MSVPEEMYIVVNVMLWNYAEEIGAEHEPAVGSTPGHVKIGNMQYVYGMRAEGVIIGTKTVSYENLDEMIPVLEELIEEHSK